ncbi:MAG: CotH kinase family protein [Saprospiraceae bacterium]
MNSTHFHHGLRKVSLYLGSFFLLQTIQGQNFVSSNLPIVLITTEINPSTGQPFNIKEEVKVPASMKIIWKEDGTRNTLSDQFNPLFLNYDGKIGIEIRGQTSTSLPKKPYGFETVQEDLMTNNNVSILGMPEENDWVLNACAFDKSLIRDNLTFLFSQKIGLYAPRGRYCEVLLNGQYIGVYVLLEKIKQDKNRVDVAELGTEDIDGTNVTGGYITKTDKFSPGDFNHWSYVSHIGQPTFFIHHEPKPDVILPTQHLYIKQQFDKLEENAAWNPSKLHGFPSLIDMASFIDFMLINELASNVDAYQYSTFYHKERGGKLRAGPVWDINLAYGNDLFQWGYDRSKTDVWQFDNFDNVGAKFWKNLFLNPTFACHFSQRWKELTREAGVLQTPKMLQMVDSLTALLSEAVGREHQKWNTLDNYTSHVNELKLWISNRVAWINQHIAPLNNCIFADIPPIVISRIHYHPKKEDGFESTDLEYVELTNNGGEMHDMSGYYVSEPGLGFVFPNNAFIHPGQKIFLASNQQAFEAFYGFAPYGQFVRNLSNSAYHIILRNPYGEIIDNVFYTDNFPWPKDADGNGPCLILNSLNVDNSKGENWSATDEKLVKTESHKVSRLKLYPNPFVDQVYIAIEHDGIENVELFSALGELMPCVFYQNYLTTENLVSGVYFTHIKTSSGKIIIAKIVKCG